MLQVFISDIQKIPFQRQSEFGTDSRTVRHEHTVHVFFFQMTFQSIAEVSVHLRNQTKILIGYGAQLFSSAFGTSFAAASEIAALAKIHNNLRRIQMIHDVVPELIIQPYTSDNLLTSSSISVERPPLIMTQENNFFIEQALLREITSIIS